MSRSNRGRQRTILGASIIVAVVIVAVIAGILIGAKGFEVALPAISGGVGLVAISLLYWLRTGKHDADAHDQD